MARTTDTPEIVFLDVETMRCEKGRFTILEFGAILLSPNTLAELDRPYSKLVRPADPNQILYLSDRRNGITKEAIADAGTFADIADEVYHLLHGRIWAGHNIREWDCPRIKEAFSEINRSAPEPRGIIDSIQLLKPGFARRAGGMALENLARHFNLGEQTHRSLDDVRMNFEVIKSCATVLFLESSLPNIFTDYNWVSPDDIDVESHDTSIPPISVTLKPGSQKILVLHRNLPLKFFCKNLKICFTIGAKYTDHRGRPLLNFVVFASQRLGIVLKTCDSLAQKLSAGCGSDPEKWQPLVKINEGFDELPTVRMNLRYEEDVDMPRLATQIYQNNDGDIKRVVISTSDATELNPLLTRGSLVDAYFCLDTYDYNKKAGIKLVAEKLIVHS